jgi:hypothetical protein
MEIIFKYLWIIFIAVTIANGYILKSRSEKYISEKPELKDGYDKFFRGLIFYGNIPWMIIAIGNTSGLTESFFEYLNPKTLNPMVLVFHGSLIVLWMLSIRWIYFKEGAEFLEEHPGLFVKKGFSNNPNLSAKEIKRMWPLMILAGIFAMSMMWVIDIPLPVIK